MVAKKCTDCQIEKLLSDFPATPNCVDGRRSYCKQCYTKRRRLRRQEDPTLATKHAERSRKWVVKNPVKRKAAQDEFNKKYRQDGRQHKAKLRARSLKPDVYRAHVSARRARVRQSMPPWADRKAIRSIYAAAVRAGMTVDHIVPIRGLLVSGLHVPWNLQIISLSENSKKRNSYTP